jgi:hypothetical protein
LKAEVPYSNEIIAENIKDLKDTLVVIDELYNDPSISTKRWDGVKSAMYEHQRSIDNLIIKLK